MLIFLMTMISCFFVLRFNVANITVLFDTCLYFTPNIITTKINAEKGYPILALQLILFKIQLYVNEYVVLFYFLKKIFDISS